MGSCASSLKNAVYPELYRREYSRLFVIKDSVLSTDEFAGGNYEGIKTMHAAEFLLSG